METENRQRNRSFKRARDPEMENFNHIEHVTQTKHLAKWKWRKVFMILFYVVFVLALFFLLVRLNPYLIALLAMATVILVFFTWRYVSVEYEYVLDSGALTFTYIYGNRSKKVAFTVPLKEIVCIAPVSDDEAWKQAQSYAPARTYDGIGDLNHPQCYFLLFENKKKERSIFYFEATPKVLNLMRFYNAPALRKQS